MRDPLLLAFPERVHGVRSMLVEKPLQEMEDHYSPDTVGYDFIRDLILVLRAKNYEEPTSRYHHIKAPIEGIQICQVRQPQRSECSGPHCPRHRSKGLDQQAYEQKTQNIQNA
ncbi:AV2 [Tomato leaf curl New Delhi virus 4]|uniref:Protein V2 n=1 Tax=Tomato leaf curl New Delhi virus 4 TaxID=2049944 RepID=V5N3Q2_9GEMI|nr:AV2 [Tomato leaf curl New Delhi virus 4]AHA82272.1 AV2 [Tomato leaf curl New Delhi virus 4]